MGKQARPIPLKKIKILAVFGTRPEIIKLFPVIQELKSHSKEASLTLCLTAQHREMMTPFLENFRIRPDYDLKVMLRNQSPSQVASLILARLEPVLLAERPDVVIVQGDTTTAAAAALCAFYSRVRVAHVEAGLRTFDPRRPFPEEINRTLVGAVADLHFAPTLRAKRNLLQAGVPKQRICLTGNPVIDALRLIPDRPFDKNGLSRAERPGAAGSKIILVTAHRRENFGRPLKNICRALRILQARFSDQARIIFPVHLNPHVREVVYPALSGLKGIALWPPLDYFSMVALMRRAYCVLTDSGGIQEEAPSFGKPVLVLREVTERPEAVEAGTARLVGTDTSRIVRETSRLLLDARAYNKMARAVNPYGDGHAARRIVAVLLGKPWKPFRARY